MDALLIVQFSSDWIKSVGGVGLWNFQPHMGVNKNSKVP